MYRLALALVLFLTMLAPALTVQAQTPPATVLLGKYGANASNGVDAYRPRQFNEGLTLPDTYYAGQWIVTNDGTYDGWDIFAFGGVGGSFAAEVSNAWATFNATRAVTVAYIDRDNGALPSWISADGWTYGGTIDVAQPSSDPRHWTDTYPVYTKSFSAGTVTIKSPATSGNPGTKVLPWILFAESGGVPSVAPAVPAGQTAPVPNQLCPAWVHDSIKAPNSNWATWHGPVNYTYWCYYGHEHGSDPSLNFGNDIGRYPRFGEIAAAGGMTENHWGHKAYAVDYPDVDMLFVHHFGTWGLGRVNTCAQRFHLVEVSIRNNAHTETLMIIRFMADYGRSIGMLINDERLGPINPDVCPNGNAATGYTLASPSRQVPVVPFGYNPNAPESNAYEPWVFEQDHYLATLGLGGNFVFNTVDPLTVPTDNTGNTAYEVMNRSGTGRFFTPNEMSFHCPSFANAQGYWWTDAMAMQVVTSTTPGAVRQFCKPGWTGFEEMAAGSPNSSHRGGQNMARWGDWAVTVPTGDPGDFENSITAAHGPN